MTIGALSANSLLMLGFAQKTRGNAQTDFDVGKNLQANSAAPLSILPISSAPPISFESILALQKIEDPEPTTIEPPTAEELFLEEARKHPMERLREQILEQLGITEEELAQLPPEEKRAMEDKISKLIEEKLRQANGAENAPPGSNTEMLQQLG